MRLGALILAVCVGLGILEALQLRLGTGEMAEGEWWMAFWRAVPSWMLLAAMSPAVVWAADRWPIRGEDWKAGLARHLLIAVPFALAHLALAALWGVLRPGAAVGSFGEAYGWLASRYFVYSVLAYGALVGVVHAYRYHREVERRRQESRALLVDLDRARARALEGKLHPHFVFNTLNAIVGLATRGDHQGVVATLDAFSQLLQATLDDRSAQTVPLSEELEILRSYIAIQQVRFGDRLRVEWQVDEDAMSFPVPGLLLQPLVENALTHGVGRSRTGGTVAITASVTDEGLEIDVTDSGPGPSPTPPRQSFSSGRGIGLESTRSRLASLFGEDARVELSSSRTGGGTTARVVIPGSG